MADRGRLSLIDLALAFVLEHPAVSAAIIGPRTMEQLESQLSAPDIRLERPSSIASTRSSPRHQSIPRSRVDASHLTNARRRRRRHADRSDGGRQYPADS